MHMPPLIRKYKIQLIAGFLFLYLAAALQAPLLEGLHLLSHLFQHEHSPGHHFHTHGGHEHHHHSILDAAGRLLSLFSGSPAPEPEKGKTDGARKKLAIHLGISCPTFFSFHISTPEPCHLPFHPVLFFPEAPTPPPRSA